MVLCFSAHGTYIGRIGLEAEKMEQVLPESTFHLGASTRRYVLRSQLRAGGAYSDGGGVYSDAGGGPIGIKGSTDPLSGLPAEEEELNVPYDDCL